MILKEQIKELKAKLADSELKVSSLGIDITNRDNEISRLKNLNRSLENKLESQKLELDRTSGYKQDMINLQNANQAIGADLRNTKANYEKSKEREEELLRSSKTLKNMIKAAVDQI